MFPGVDKRGSSVDRGVDGLVVDPGVDKRRSRVDSEGGVFIKVPINKL